MPVPSLASVMSTFPVRVGPDTTVAAAVALLEEHGFHHLPVSDGDTVVGVVSAAVLQAAVAAGGEGLALSALCEGTPLTIDISAPMREVAHRMRAASADAAVVVTRGRVAGIVTTSDLCTVLVEMIPGPPLGSGPSDVA